MDQTQRYSARSVWMTMVLMVMTSCAPDSPSADGGGTSLPTGSVKTQLAINVPKAGGKTRMSGQTVQDNDVAYTFRGLTDMTLYSLQMADGSTDVTQASITRRTDLAGFEPRQDAYGTGVADKSGEYKIYRDIDIPVGTDHFLLYAQALADKADSASTQQLKFSSGYLRPSLPEATATAAPRIGQFAFGLSPITTADAFKADHVQDAILMALNSVVNCQAWAGSAAKGDVFYRERLKTLRQGSSNGIFLTMTDLYDKVTHASDYGMTATVAQAVEEAIRKAFVVDEATGKVTAFKLQSVFSAVLPTEPSDPDEDIEIQSVGPGGHPSVPVAQPSDGQAHLGEPATMKGQAVGTRAGGTDTPTTSVGKIEEWACTPPADYPCNLGLPEGAARIVYDTDKEQFAFVEEGATYGADLHVSVASLAYPAALYYFDSTPLKATSSAFSEWPTTASDWTAAGEEGGRFANWDDAVQSNTSTVALKDNINYGVALLKINVMCVGDKLTDNGKEKADDKQTHTVTVPADGFPVTGVLIGGQPERLKWNMQPADGTPFDMTIYDKAVTEGMTAPRNEAGKYNYTLVLDNRNHDVTIASPTDEERQQSVYVAVEFRNTSGTDFYGNEGLIKQGQTFYLVAKVDIDPQNDWAPSDDADSDIHNPSAFMQDYVTELRLRISSLRNAYNTVPDLEMPQLKLGLSVNLTWNKGLSKDITFE